MKTYVPSRTDWVERTKAKLDEIDESLTTLEAKAATARDGASARIDAELKAARKALQQAQARWQAAKETADDVWESVSEEVGTAWQLNRIALQNSVDEIRSAMEKS